MANIRSGTLSPTLGVILQGEALFNDGVGLVAFTAALAFASSGAAPDLLHEALTILVEVGGGLALGGVGGWAVGRLMRNLEDYFVELTLTLALAAGVYVLAQALHVSGAIAAGAAGLVVGSHSGRTGDGDARGEAIRTFWHAIDEVLNGLLFLLLGLQIFIVPFESREVGVWAVAIVLVLAARLIVVLPWGAYFRVQHKERAASLLLAWGGLRGAISLALALSIPEGGPKSLILSTTFAVVAFSVVAQGLTFGRLAAQMKRRTQGLPQSESGNTMLH